MNRKRIIRLLVTLAIFGVAGFFLRGYTTDDTFIHLRYARNMIELGEFSFNPGHDTFGATSPLWIFGLVLLLKLGIPPLTAAWVLGAFSGLAMVLIVDAIVERLTIPDRWKLALMVVVVGDVWFLRWTFSGMETPLATALLVSLLWPLVSRRHWVWQPERGPLWHRYLAWGVMAGMAGMVRPELLLAAPLALPWLLFFEYFRAAAIGGKAARFRARPQAPLVAAVCGWAVVVLPWMAFAWIRFGRLIPETVTAKTQTLTLDPTLLFPNLFRSVGMLAVAQGPLWFGLILIAAVILRRHKSAGVEGEDEWPPRWSASGEDSLEPEPWSVWGPMALVGIVATWSAVLLGGFAVKQVWVISRYVSPLAPSLLLAMSVIAEWLLRGDAVTRSMLRTGRAIIAVTVVATLAMNGWVFGTKLLPHARAFARDLDGCYVEMGRWLRDNTPEDAVVAALDIGALGFESDRQVLDLMGLVSPRILEMGREMGFQQLVDSGLWVDAVTGPDGRGRAPSYFVDRSEGPPRWRDRTVGGTRFEVLDTCTMHGLGLNEPQAWTVTLYRLVSAEKGVNSSTGG
jgi:hypothetical protein